MPKPANVMTTSAPGDDYEELNHDALVDLAKSRGIDLGTGYTPKKDVIAALRAQEAKSDGHPVEVEPGADLGATENFVAPGQPAHRYDANKRQTYRERYDVVRLNRAELARMAKGEVVEVDGLKLAAGDDFPPHHKIVT